MTHLLNAFDWQPRTRLIFGNGTLDRLGEAACDLGAQRALIVTDAGIVAAGHLERARASLEAVGLTVAVFDAVRQNPTTEDVDACVSVARAADPNLLIGLGGGSSMDTAKGANFLLTNGREMRDYRGTGGVAKNPMLPFIAVPTTAGTGSEMQSFALIADAETHQKMACGDPKATARVAILDPLLTVSQPRGVTVFTGMDAITHAVETAVTRRRNPVSWLYSREAFRLLTTNFPMVLNVGGDVEARAGMLLGAAYAGLAIENSMLGAAHSLANPLTAHFDVIHGQAVGMMLPHVVRFNAEDQGTRGIYRELAVAADIVKPSATAEEAVAALVFRLNAHLSEAGMLPSLAACGVTEDAIPMLSEEAAAQWTAQFNPRPVTAEDLAGLYRAAYE
jgi:alcohol dehydrogenase